MPVLEGANTGPLFQQINQDRWKCIPDEFNVIDQSSRPHFEMDNRKEALELKKCTKYVHSKLRVGNATMLCLKLKNGLLMEIISGLLRRLSHIWLILTIGIKHALWNNLKTKRGRWTC